MANLSRGSNSNPLLSTATTASEEEEAPVHARGTELRARLRVMERRDETSWSVNEMKAALKAGGLDVTGSVDKAELRSRTKALHEAAKARWAAEAEAEAIMTAKALAEAAEAQMAAQHKQAAADKFKARSRHLLRSRGRAEPAAGGGTDRADVSDDSEFDSDILSNRSSQPPSSHRGTFRARGGAGAALSARGAGGREAAAPAVGQEAREDEVLTMLHAVLVPRCLPRRTAWAQAVARCLPQP